MTCYDEDCRSACIWAADRIADLEVALADSERRADLSDQLVADLACGHGVATEHRAALERVARLEAKVERLRARMKEINDAVEDREGFVFGGPARLCGTLIRISRDALAEKE